MQKFWVVTADDGNNKRAIICEEPYLDGARGKLLDEGFSVSQMKWYPVECHWSARVTRARKFSDWDQKTEE